MNFQPARILRLLVVLGLSVTPLARQQIRAETSTAEPSLETALQQILSVLSPGPDAAPQTFTSTVRFVRAAGLPAEVLGHKATLALQMPDHLRLSVSVDGETFRVGRNKTQLWMHASRKKFGIIGSPEAPRFRTDEGRQDNSTLPPLRLPVSREQLLLLPLLCQMERLPEEEVGRDRCFVWRITPRPEAQAAMKLPSFTVMLWLRPDDLAPRRIGYSDGGKVDVVLELDDLELAGPRPEAEWGLKPAAGDHIETVALSHVTRSIRAMLGGLGDRVPALGPPTGERRVLARHGKGRLEMRDGTRVLFLQGTPEEMGAQHGTLMKKEVHHLVERILYGVGVGSSLAKGRWFFGEIEEAQARLQPFMDARYLREMDALAAAAGVRIEEVRLANFFPELFHCSGFALFGDATAGGRMFHGRILDYLKGVGLEQNACVIVVQPDEGHAWVNVGYAGFIGSVTAMNEKHIAIGEMGGRGEGHWDGKPMAQLMREVMEKASTIDEAVEIMRRKPAHLRVLLCHLRCEIEARRGHRRHAGEIRDHLGRRKPSAAAAAHQGHRAHVRRRPLRDPDRARARRLWTLHRRQRARPHDPPRVHDFEHPLRALRAGHARFLGGECRLRERRQPDALHAL